MISRLAVTEANMVSLTTGELVVKGKDGSFYAISVDSSGKVIATLKQIDNADVKDLSINAGEKIIEGTVTAACLNATDIFADNATIRGLMAANIDVDTLFARDAFLKKLTTSNIVGGESLTIIAGKATDAKNKAESAQSAAGTAQSAANAARSTANSASSAANAAQNAANNAQTAADNASAAADEAQTTADSAANNANDAMNVANAAVSQEEFKRVVRIDEEGLHVGDNLADGKDNNQPKCEVLLDSISLNVVRDGERLSTLGDKYVRFGKMQVHLVSGGLAISVYKE